MLDVMTITAPQRFRHSGDLSARFASKDPRQPIFVEPKVDIDMRPCQFIQPAAVLWCAVYPLLALARGSVCRLFVPENLGVATYLKSCGLFPLLKEAGVEIDDRGINARADNQLIVPLTRFQTQADAEELANKALDSLSNSGLASGNLHTLVSEIFAELALNATEHSKSEIGAFGLLQFYDFEYGKRFACSVADGGIGIRKSLEQNPTLRDKIPYDWVAVELALRERVSGTGSKTRGIGLYGIAEDMRRAKRQLIIHSGIGMVEISEQIESRSRRTTLFPGTLAYASIPG